MCSSITGGWNRIANTYFGNEYIRIGTIGVDTTGIVTNVNKIDITDYKTLKFDCQLNYVSGTYYINSGLVITNYYSTVEIGNEYRTYTEPNSSHGGKWSYKKLNKSISARQTISIDLTQFTDKNVYIHPRTRGHSMLLYVYRIWLEE